MPEEPVEILVQMAERGEIDPWNIDIVEVTDRFLSELERRKELDLRISGRTLFYAALLLRMKSEILEQAEVVEDDEYCGEEDVGEEEFGPDAEFDQEGNALGPIERLEREIRRRLDRKQLRKRPITLFELILELKAAEKEQRRRQRFISPFDPRLIDVEDVVGIAHDEGYRETAMAVLCQCEESIEKHGIMTLEELAEMMGKRIIDVYIPLLYLMFEGKLALWQDEFFGQVFVQVWRAEDVPAAIEN
ncbi:MAG: segregation and condensation protein A [Methanoregulaceae archaeon PtaB.Bin009]|jgi:segregation and condensation protein A|nr:MAG: segregation and condensation protein A [Methanoregulaceae archaeon PtaB.Bin009]OPY41402.1 MAG: segregation and condensation protein A [Methanoregulaceae archaeon PtaU1.Bin066]HNQ29580.1 ScpA family protein [Methanolinea sp.]